MVPRGSLSGLFEQVSGLGGLNHARSNLRYTPIDINFTEVFAAVLLIGP